MGEYIRVSCKQKDSAGKVWFNQKLNKEKWTIGVGALFFKPEDIVDDTLSVKVSKAKETLQERLSVLNPDTPVGKSLIPIATRFLRYLNCFNDEWDIISESTDETVLKSTQKETLKKYEEMFENIKQGYKGKKSNIDIIKNLKELEEIEKIFKSKILPIEEIIISERYYGKDYERIKSRYKETDRVFCYPILIKFSCHDGLVKNLLSQFSCFDDIKETKTHYIGKLFVSPQIMQTYLVFVQK